MNKIEIFVGCFEGVLDGVIVGFIVGFYNQYNVSYVIISYLHLVSYLTCVGSVGAFDGIGVGSTVGGG